MNAFGPSPPEFDSNYAAINKQTGEIVAVGMSAPGVLADASEKTGLPRDCFQRRQISKDEYERFKSIGIQEKREIPATPHLQNPLPSKASKRGHIDGVEPGDRILHLHTRCAVDDEARGLQYFHKSLAKVRAEPLQVSHDSGGVLEALIDVADVSIITDCPMVIEHTYLIFPGRFNQLRI
jgi:hypothetical protein